MRDTSIKRELLLRYAYEAGRRQHWLEAYALWNELDHLYPLALHRVMTLENARMAGILPIIDLSRRDRAVDIIDVLSPPYAKDLLTEVLRRRRSISQGELSLIEDTYPRIPDGIRRSLLETTLRGGSDRPLAHFDVEAVELSSIADAPTNSSDLLFPEYDVVLPILNSAFSEVPIENQVIQAHVRETRRLALRDAIFTSESDAIDLDGKWFVDSLSYPQSAMLDVCNDPIILAFDGKRAAISLDQAPPQIAGSGLWLAYPLTHAWGHFVLECLTRLAVFQAIAPGSSERVIVSSTVPQSFLNFAKYLYPWANFVRLNPGTRVKIEDCSLIPSRVLTPGRIRWSSDGNKHPNMEPQSMRLLAKDMAKSLARNLDEKRMFSRRVYLDRRAATYRKSKSESSVRAIAQKHNFFVVDPGTLAPREEVNLLANATDVCGFSGSQLLLTVGMTHSKSQLYFYHDESSEMRGMTFTLSTCTGTEPTWILGIRSQYVPGYSEQSIHQQILLSENALVAANAWFSNASMD